MDKNIIIAILLSIIIIVLYSSPQYQKRFGKEVQKPVVETTTQPDTLKKTPVQSITPKPEIEKPAPPVTTEIHESTVQDTTSSAITQINAPASTNTITIENENIRVLLSQKGGAILNAEMKNYSGISDDEPAQLVYKGQSWYTTEIRDGETVIPLDDVPFEIMQNSSTHILMSATFSNGLTVERTYDLNSEGFVLNTDTQLSGSVDNPELHYSWIGPVNETEAPTKKLNIWPFSMMMRDDSVYYSKITYLGQGSRTTLVENGKTKEKRVYSNEGAQKVEVKKSNSTEDLFDGDLEWYAIRNKYFMTAAVPVHSKLWKASSYATKYDGENWFAFTISKRVADGDTGLEIYLGPISYSILKSYRQNMTEVMELSWRFIRPLAIAFLWVIKKLRTFIPNWGLVIIIFSVLIKVVLFPLSKSSLKSMHKMSQLQPEITKLKEKYKNNPQKQQQEMMALYREQGVNPLGGCLPMLLQMPVFFALYPVIGRAFELRQAMFIPYWIEDLSRPDPFYILPVAMGISMFFQSKVTMTDPNQKAMLYVMPVMMIILFSNFSSGLTLYWFMFNIMTYIQQKLIRT